MVKSLGFSRWAGIKYAESDCLIVGEGLGNHHSEIDMVSKKGGGLRVLQWDPWAYLGKLICTSIINPWSASKCPHLQACQGVILFKH